jgi:hypothetical protein
MMQVGDYINLFTSIIITSGIIVAIYQISILRKQLNIQKKQIEDQHAWYRKEKGLSFSNLYHPKLREIKETLNNSFKIISRTDAISESEFKSKIMKDDSLVNKLNSLLTYYECVAISYYHNLSDREIIYDLMANTLIINRKRLINYIDCRRKDIGNKRLWENFVRLANEFEGMQNKTKKKEELGKFN